MKRHIAGWPLVGWTALGVATMSLTILLVRGGGEAGLRTLLRATARVGSLLFLATFVAAPAHRLLTHPTTRWLLHNRRYLGVSFALCHTVHLMAVLALARYAKPATFVLVSGILPYALMYAMAATSFDATAAWLGRRGWRVLHTTGAYVLWFAFAIDYVPLVGRSFAYLPLALALVGAAGLRLYDWRVRREPAHA